MQENKIRIRAKATFPTVLLTLLSIVQALALELMWNYVTAQPQLYAWTFTAFLGWLQIAANLLGVLLIWLIYSDLVLRLTWVPTTTDAIFPFLVGIVEFAQIELLGPAMLGAWFVALSVLFAAMTWISQTTMRRARKDPDNEEFFSKIGPATFRDHAISAIPVLVLMLFGLTIWVTSNRGWFSGIALMLVNLLLFYQIWMNHQFTQRSYRSH